jgi:hypothetical protein
MLFETAACDSTEKHVEIVVFAAHRTNDYRRIVSPTQATTNCTALTMRASTSFNVFRDKGGLGG